MREQGRFLMGKSLNMYTHNFLRPTHLLDVLEPVEVTIRVKKINK